MFMASTVGLPQFSVRSSVSIVLASEDANGVLTESDQLRLELGSEFAMNSSLVQRACSGSRSLGVTVKS